MNQVCVLPRNQQGAQNLILFAATIQSDVRPSRIIGIRHATNYDNPYDR